MLIAIDKRNDENAALASAGFVSWDMTFCIAGLDER